ncbi:MAG: DNA cytosine methyltransferase [Nitrososphaerales archaeon]
MKDSSGKPRVLDLFCGAGGMSLGFQKAGFDILAGIDIDKPSVETFKNNFPEALALVKDLKSYTPWDFAREYGFGKGSFEVIVGGPPCQGFSISGPRRFHDKRNRLYLEFIEYVKFFCPRTFVIENVPGLLSLYEGRVKDRILIEFSRIGYCVRLKVLNAADYGVPQTRKRAFFVGRKSGARYQFPDQTHADATDQKLLLGDLRKKITVCDAISDLPLLEKGEGESKTVYASYPQNDYQKMMREGSAYIFNHLAPNHAPRTMEIIALVPQGKNYKTLPEELQQVRRFHVAWTRLDGSKPSPTIDAGHRHHFHPVANRNPTVRECARIQSFPDKFVFFGTKTSQYRQVGNAVPPLLAYSIAASLQRD